VRALSLSLVEVVPGVPLALVVRQAMRVKRASMPWYSAEDFVQDVVVKLLGCIGWDSRRGAAAVFVRVVARSVLRDQARRDARRALSVKPTPPTRGGTRRISRAQDRKLCDFGACA
jgi:DNA-directed RNA polymerase specialized sigma24 family protein